MVDNILGVYLTSSLPSPTKLMDTSILILFDLPPPPKQNYCIGQQILFAPLPPPPPPHTHKVQANINNIWHTLIFVWHWYECFLHNCVQQKVMFKHARFIMDVTKMTFKWNNWRQLFDHKVVYTCPLRRENLKHRCGISSGHATWPNLYIQCQSVIWNYVCVCCSTAVSS